MELNLPPALQNTVGRLFEAAPVSLPGGIQFSYIQAILVVVLLFLLVMTLGHVRHTYVDWSIKGVAPGFTSGFIVAIILEGLFILGGRTVFTQILGWHDAPKPISTVLDASRTKLVDVLGVKDQIPTSNASEPETADKILKRIELLDESEHQKLQSNLCEVK